MKIAIFCSIFLLHFPQFVHAASKKVCFGYSGPFIVYAHHGHVMMYNFDTKLDQKSGKQCVGINPQRWKDMASDIEITFKLQNGTEAGRATVEELRDTEYRNLPIMMKKRIYFSWDYQPLYIFANYGQQNIHQQETSTEMLSDGTYKQYLEIDPDKWTNLDYADWIIFELNTQQEVGRATVSELRDTVALIMKKKIYFSWDVRQLTISAFQSGGHIFTQQTEFDHLTNKSYLEFYPYQWNGLQNNADNDVVTFKINLEEIIGSVRIGELRKTTALSLMVKKRVYFPYFNGQPYKIKALDQNGQQPIPNFTGRQAQLQGSENNANNKRYLEIDPDLFAHLQNNDVIIFYRRRANHPDARLGRATVAILREVGDIDFSGGARNFGSLSGGF